MPCSTPKTAVPKKRARTRWTGVTVLAVDDHLPNLLVLDALLSELGIQVITASSGFDAIEIISKQQTKNIKTAKSDKQSLSNKTQISKAETRDEVNKKSNSTLYEEVNTDDKVAIQDKGHIDLIFMDIQMPRMSGHEAARQIRNIENDDSRIPIIALTAHGLADERDKLIASGINDYVGKPISQPQLLQVLQKWLGRTTTMPQLTALPDTNLHSTDVHNTDVQVIDLSKDNSHSTDLQNREAETYSTWPSDSTTIAYPMVKGDENNRHSGSNTINQPKITRPLSLKKIRDNYLRDSQPREDYRRETPRDTQPRYENLRLHKQGQSPLLKPSETPINSAHDGVATPTDSHTYAQETKGWDSSHHHLSHHSLEANEGDGFAILDWQDALTRSANKPDLAAKLIIMMLDTINDEKQALTQAWDTRDRSMLAQIAHRILGGSRYTGVPQLRQASQDLEDKCLLNVQHTTPAQFAMLEPYYAALITALNNLQALDLSAYPQLNYHRLSENDMTWKMI